MLVAGCGSGTAGPRVAPKSTYGHTTVEACSAINYVRTNGENWDTVPNGIRPTLTDSPIADAWAKHYAAMLVAANMPGDDPKYDQEHAKEEGTSKVLSALCSKVGVTLVGPDEDYFLPSY